MTRALTALAVVLSIVFGWHVYCASDMRRQAEEMLGRRKAGEGADPVRVNPLTNVVIVPIGPAKRKQGSENPLEALGSALGSVLGGAIAGALEPSIERELNLRAREHYDLYSMLLPYRVRVLAPDAAP